VFDDLREPPLDRSALALPEAGRPHRRRPTLADRVRDAIYTDFIADGTTPSGGRLPTETKLCERYAVSRITARTALRSLQDAGLVVTRQGQGTTVLPRAETIVSGLDRLCSFETYAREEGRDVDTASLEIEEIEATGTIAQRLGVAAGTPTLVIARVKLYGGARIGWIVDYVPDGVLRFPAIVAEFDGSVLDVLLEHAELEVDYADCDIEPVVLDGDLARRLHAAPGTPALHLDELTRTRSGQVVNWSQAWLLPEHLRFCLRRRRQFGR
jgi:GntR family transcriptional regulator